jgi:hypothetical protein
MCLSGLRELRFALQPGRAARPLFCGNVFQVAEVIGKLVATSGFPFQFVIGAATPALYF